MIAYHHQKYALSLLLACLVVGAVALAREKHDKQASSDVSLFSCPAGQEDAMQYFVMRKDLREDHYLSGETNPSYTKIFPDVDFAPTGYWLWLKSPEAHGSAHAWIGIILGFVQVLTSCGWAIFGISLLMGGRR